MCYNRTYNQKGHCVKVTRCEKQITCRNRWMYLLVPAYLGSPGQCEYTFTPPGEYDRSTFVAAAMWPLATFTVATCRRAGGVESYPPVCVRVDLWDQSRRPIHVQSGPRNCQSAIRHRSQDVSASVMPGHYRPCFRYCDVCCLLKIDITSVRL